LVSGLMAGLVGGALGVLAAENLNNPADWNSAIGEDAFRNDWALYLAILGTVLGFVLLAWEGLVAGSGARAFRDGGIGAAVGAAGGYVGGLLSAEALAATSPTEEDYERRFGDLSLEEIEELLSDLNRFITDLIAEHRVPFMLSLALFGAVIGLGLGIPGGPKRVVNGVIGGIVGGALSGLAYIQLLIITIPSHDEIERSFRTGEPLEPDLSPFLVNLIAFTLAGVGIGIAVGLVDRLTRQAWLQVTTGPMVGKEFILFKPTTTVGADYRCDIVLVKDRSIEPRVLSFVRSDRGQTSVIAEYGVAVQVNGGPIEHHRLRHGDRVTVGATTFAYQERAG